MKKLIIIWTIILLNACNGQEIKENKTTKANKSVEKLDIQQIEKEGCKSPISNTEYSYEWTKKFEDGSSFSITGSVYENGFVKYEYPAIPSFYIIYKEFYANGNIKKKETYLGEHVKIDTSKYYDEQGNLVSELDENKKFGKIKPQQILEFLQQKKYINLQTGEGREDEDGRPTFDLGFQDENEKKTWFISIRKGKPNDDPSKFPDIGEPPAFLPLSYEMDGETGVVKKLP